MLEIGGNFSITPELLHRFTHLTDQKVVRAGGLFVFYPLTLTPFYPRWKPNAAQKDVRVLSCIFLENPAIAAPLLRHFGRTNSTRVQKLSI